MVNAQSSREIARNRIRSATLMPGQIRRLNWVLATVRNGNGKTMDLPSTETPVVALHCVCLMSRLRRAEIIAEVAVGVEGITVGGMNNLFINMIHCAQQLTDLRSAARYDAG